MEVGLPKIPQAQPIGRHRFVLFDAEGIDLDTPQIVMERHTRAILDLAQERFRAYKKKFEEFKIDTEKPQVRTVAIGVRA